MARLYSDLRDGSSRQYYFAMASAPGGLQPGNLAGITILGLQPQVFLPNQVFRTPDPAVITISNLALKSGPQLQPVPGVITLNQLVPGLQTLRIITPTLPAPDYAALPDNAPSIVFIQTVSPARATITLSPLTFALNQGGNIGFLSPGLASIAVTGRAAALSYGEVGIGQVAVQGLVPTLQTEVVLMPNSAIGENPEDDDDAQVALSIRVIGYAPTLDTPFKWIDVAPPPAVTWTPTTGVAA